MALERRPGVAREVKFLSFFEEIAEPLRKLLATAWASRGKLARDVVAYVALVFGTICSMPGRAVKVISNPKLQELLAEEEDPMALAAVVFGAGGALSVGSAGGIVGATVGGTVGVVVGVVPALFTFGLSIPLGAIIGGAVGLAGGAAIGGGAGFVGGAASGSVLAYFRTELRYVAVLASAKLYDAYDVVIVRPTCAAKSTARKVRSTALDSAEFTVAKAAAVAGVLRRTAADRRVQATVAGAGAGAATLGTAGAAGGTIVGGSAGALIGLVPAIFTFGLSIPVGAIAGGLVGGCAGTVCGTTIGFGAGGALGLGAYSARGAPQSVVKAARAAAYRARGVLTGGGAKEL